MPKDISISVPYGDTTVNMTIPKDKIKFDKSGQNIVDIDHDFISQTAEEIIKNRNVAPEKDTTPPLVKHPFATNLRGGPDVAKPKPTNLMGHLKEIGSTALSTMNPLNVARSQVPQDVVTPEDVQSGMQNIPIPHNLDEAIGQTLPFAASGVWAGSPKLRTAVKSSVSDTFNNIRGSEVNRWGPGGLLGAGIGFLTHPNWTGIAGGSIAGAGSQMFGESAIAGVKSGLRNAASQPWVDPAISQAVQGFLRKSAGSPSPALLPQSQPPIVTPQPQFKQLPAPVAEQPSNIVTQPQEPNFQYGQRPQAQPQFMGPQQLPQPQTGPAIQMPAASVDINPSLGPKALPAPGNDVIRTRGMIPLPTAVESSNVVTSESIGQKLVPQVRREAMVKENTGQEQPQVTKEQLGKQLTPKVEKPEKVTEENWHKQSEFSSKAGPPKSQLKVVNPNKKGLSAEEMMKSVKESKSNEESKSTETSKEKQAKEASNTITTPETEQSQTITHEEIGKIADALGVKFTHAARALESKGYDVQKSKFGSGSYGLKLGKKDINSLLDEIGEKKLNNILELMDKKKLGQR